jgi:hypothetical protein
LKNQQLYISGQAFLGSNNVQINFCNFIQQDLPFVCAATFGQLRKKVLQIFLSLLFFPFTLIAFVFAMGSLIDPLSDDTLSLASS